MGFGSSSQNTSGTDYTDQTQTMRRSFDSPEAKQLLSALTGMYGGQQFQQGGQNAQAALSGLLQQQGNPYVDDVIASGDQQATQRFDTSLAKARAGGYRGGTGANLINQGLLASDFAAKQQQGNNQLRYDAYGQDFNRRLNAAQALGQQSSSQSAGAQNLLDMLSTQNISNQGTTTNRSASKGKSSNVDAAALASAAALAFMAF